MTELSLNDVELEEWNIRSCKSINPKFDTLSLNNEGKKEIDTHQLKHHLAGIKGINNIKSLVLEYSSLLKDLSFLEALPKLETLDLYGWKLLNLDGLEFFQNGRYIAIDTGKNTRRKIDKIAATNIGKLNLRYAHPGDSEAIRHCHTLNSLSLSSCPALSLKLWKNVPLEYMSLSGGNIDILSSTAHIPTLSFLQIHGCTKLQHLKGNNSNITRLIIQSCSRLDLRDIKSFSNVEAVDIVSVKKPIPLSIFSKLRKLTHLDLHNCKVDLDVMSLKKKNLKEIAIYTLKKPEGIKLSQANPDVVVTNACWSYKNGLAYVEQG
ncbi:MAG: hypothetical protein OEZ68_19150 [Gammaproteobacteria bacterium]|nr:hypothetical protein [Gammaproteobacteria bacterium]MDH5802926.1 hypothetical protein [Gammaproteobacteria bacterium]